MLQDFPFAQWEMVLRYLEQNLGWSNPWQIIQMILDVSLVSYVFYKLILLVKETRAWQLIKGILVILVLGKLTEFIGMKMTSYILNIAVQSIAIALVVLFQPELRRGLEKLGRSRFNHLLLFDEDEETKKKEERILEIVKAIFQLSKEQIGALIVLERDTKLGECIQSGIRLEAAVTSELLMNIFTPNTPLHDGAVILREEKIQAAACLLPLSQDTKIGKELGTRHRAGIGVTEISDAISIIVSEETGRVSVGMEGKLILNLTKEDLIKQLKEHWKKETLPVKRLTIWKKKKKANRNLQSNQSSV